MFTGIVQTKGKILNMNPTQGGASILVGVPTSFNKDLQRGASVAVNGVCLTVTNKSKEKISFDVIKETLRSTNLSRLNQLDEVNMERSLKFGDEVGGHLLSGHISCECQATLKKEKGEVELVVSKPKRWEKRIINKGYVALNGVSLTVSKVTKSSFSVFLIPETIKTTNLTFLDKGSTLNLEIDQNAVFHKV